MSCMSRYNQVWMGLYLCAQFRLQHQMLGDNTQRQLYPEYDPVILPDQKSWIKYDTISWKSFKLGYTHTCGVQDVTGMPICYGLRYPGLQIKIEAPSMLRFSDVSAGAFHTCGITLDGRLSCWGSSCFQKLHHPQAFAIAKRQE